jgi:putative MATE family efflux protein
MTEMEENERVELLRGDPKKAINKLALPMIASMLLMSANNIIDSIWVAGLGADPLAALGFITPLFLILVGIGAGLGAGANSLIARMIGEKKDYEASNAGIHSLILGLIATVILTILFIIFLKPLIIAMGGKDVLTHAVDYGNIIMIGIFTLTLPAIFGGICRSEGDVRRSTIPLAITAVLNMIFDPIFIYGLNMKIAGAALATVLAGVVGLACFIYWFFVKKDTFIRIERQFYKHDMKMYKEILLVGIPASIEQLIMSATAIILNAMLAAVAGTTAVAVYTAGWRLVQIGIMPAIGIGIAALTVAGVAYGERNKEKLDTTINYGVKVGLITTVIIGALFFIFSDYLAIMFSYSSSSASLAPLISEFLKIMCLYIIPVPLGVVAGNVFQAFGKGTASLLLTANRSLILDVIFCAIAAFVLSAGAVGIYWGIVIGDIVGSIMAYAAIVWYVRRLDKNGFFKKNTA